MTQDQHQELAHLRAEVDRLQAEVSRGITALSECIGERDKAYKAGLFRAAQVCRDLGRVELTGGPAEERRMVIETLEAEAQKGQS